MRPVLSHQVGASRRSPDGSRFKLGAGAGSEATRQTSLVNQVQLPPSGCPNNSVVGWGCQGEVSGVYQPQTDRQTTIWLCAPVLEPRNGNTVSQLCPRSPSSAGWGCGSQEDGARGSRGRGASQAWGRRDKRPPPRATRPSLPWILSRPQQGGVARSGAGGAAGSPEGGASGSPMTGRVPVRFTGK